MAYRTERRERPHETYAPSYLDDFLVSIEPLQPSTKSTFADIKGLDDRVQTTVALADAAADDTILRANSSAAIASVRRQYQEFIVLQTNAQELADKKADLAAAALKGLDTVLAELDDKLHDFEAQLKREGRWPGATTLTQPTQPKAPTHSTQPPTASAAPTKAAEPPATRNAHKADRRPSQPPPSSKNPVSTAAEPVAAKPVVDATPAPQDVVMKDSAPDVIKKEAQPLSDVITDSAMDNTLYCICQQVSSGNMVACEDHNCPYEWFHFECVGLTEEPDGVWYCPECTEKRKKASRRKQ